LERTLRREATVREGIEGSGGLVRAAAGLLLAAAAGCSYRGEAREFDPDDLATQPGWIAIEDVPVVLQKESVNCGEAAISMILAYWRIPMDSAELAEAAPLVPGRGSTARGLRDFARKKGLESFLIHGRLEDLQNEVAEGHPVIVGLVKPAANGPVTHYEVVVAVNPQREIIVTHDPSRGWQQNTYGGFRKEWDPAGYLTLVFTGRGGKPPDPEAHP
jgi:ABC-type bacteriocin/lantibiotic exporter with double-glycine peptidase domain